MYWNICSMCFFLSSLIILFTNHQWYLHIPFNGKKWMQTNIIINGVQFTALFTNLFKKQNYFENVCIKIVEKESFRLLVESIKTCNRFKNMMAKFNSTNADIGVDTKGTVFPQLSSFILATKYSVWLTISVFGRCLFRDDNRGVG